MSIVAGALPGLPLTCTPPDGASHLIELRRPLAQSLQRWRTQGHVTEVADSTPALLTPIFQHLASGDVMIRL